MNELKVVGRTEFAYINKKLQNATMQIFSLGNNIRQKWFEIGAIIAMVDDGEYYKDDGFNNVHEWVERSFGLKKSRSYDLLKIGKEYTREVLSKAGKVVGYECNLLPETTPDNFNTTQVTRMLPLGHDVATELVEQGVITPDMSVKAIGDVVKNHLPNKDNEGPEQSSDEMEESAAKDAQESHEEWLAITFEKITTDELIKEMNRRGFIVYDGEGTEVKGSV